MTPIRPLAALLALVLPLGAAARDHESSAREARAAGREAVSVFVDVDFGGREDRAADALNEAHAAFERQGYELVDVTAYTENGDLQGFFASYRRRAEPARR
jgi:hypothetical protein